MNKQDAIKVLNIMTSADGECSHCSGRLMNIFINKFGFKVEAKDIYKKVFNEEL